MLAAAPTTLAGFGVRTGNVDELSEDGDYQGIVTWTATDEQPEPPEDGDESFSFEAAPGTRMVYHSRQTVGVYPNNAATPRYKQAVNVDQDGNVNGVQWPPTPTQIFSKTATIAAASITQSYYRTLCALAGKINDGTFLGFQAHELLFIGASGSRRGEEPWNITYRFGFSENEDNLSIGDITGIDKDGWDYLWGKYKTVEHSDGSNAVALVQVPEAFYVERIAAEADFGDLEPA
jgi:hypothetical protein